ncbi:MAG: NAD(P)H-hydrate dehydratase [Candidatus Melainabacteria bacterium]|nr:NAD(P)H-hydrate dehydratase [Candidatus Melainabacteria bacterium]
MISSNLRIPTTAQIRELEKNYIDFVKEKTGADWGQSLMEIAGRAVAHCLLPLWNSSPGHVAIFAGTGNNGGDGMVAARYLNLWGIPASVFILGSLDDERFSAETKTMKNLLQALDIETVSLTEDYLDQELEETLDSITGGASVIIDAIFGTGLTRPVEGLHRKVIEAINNSARPVLSIDLPSGINSDSGAVMGVAVRADHTITFAHLKPGHLSYPGAEFAGDMSLVDIGLPDFDDAKEDIYNLTADRKIYLTTCGAVQGLLPLRPLDAHKGTFGQVLTVAGSLGMSGAAVMAAKSALKAGAGLSYLATPRSLIAGLPACEIVYKPLSETSKQSISAEALGELSELLGSVKACIIGPGLSQGSDSVELVFGFTEMLGISCVIDADALNCIAKNPNKFCGGKNFILTPHPRELARLLGKETEAIQADRISHALEAATRFNAVVVLKGAYTVIAEPGGRVFINPTGNPGMATAGAGDVLSGIIGGLAAQGLDTFDAACAAVYIHGRAGDLAARGEENNPNPILIASDLISQLPKAMASIVSGEVSYLEERLAQSISGL